MSENSLSLAVPVRLDEFAAGGVLPREMKTTGSPHGFIKLETNGSTRYLPTLCESGRLQTQHLSLVTTDTTGDVTLGLTTVWYAVNIDKPIPL